MDERGKRVNIRIEDITMACPSCGVLIDDYCVDDLPADVETGDE